MASNSIKQNPLTLLSPVLPEQLDGLRKVLASQKDHLLKTGTIALANLETVHFARWVIMDDQPNPANNPEAQGPKLIFSSNFDGEVNDHIRDLCTRATALIDSIYQYCEGYPAPQERNDASRIAYLSKSNIGVSAFYRGSPNRSLPQVLGEQRLRDFLRKLLNEGNWQQMQAIEIQKSLLEKVKSQPEFDWAAQPVKQTHINWPGMILFVLVILLLLPLIIVWIIVLHFRFEVKDQNFTLTRSQLDEQKIRYLESYEDLGYQNQFTQLVVMKKGWMRLKTFQGMMLFARLLIPLFFVKGKLMGIPTIHFARWVAFDNNKRVLFFSNFDGSWQQYLGDFIDKSGWGLTGIFSNTTNFPKTSFLLTGGAYDEEHFLAWSRDTEIATQLWYSAYPDLSIKNVNNNTRIRSMLYKIDSEATAKEFLSLL